MITIDKMEWLAQIHRAREALETAVTSRPDAPQIKPLLDVLEEMCAVVAKS